jgi:hypothetical protein
MVSPSITTQNLSNSLLAAAVCAHWDSGVQQLLGRVRECDLTQFNAQDLANTAWAWAVLACLAREDGAYQQHQPLFQQVAAGLLKAAASRSVSSLTLDNKRQLYQAHAYAQDLGLPGLPAGDVLQSLTAAGLDQGPPQVSGDQKDVAEELSSLGYTTELEAQTEDGLMSVDILITALPDGRPCSIAVEFDGPFHFVVEPNRFNTRKGAPPGNRVDGPTRLRNALLRKRYPDGLVIVPYFDWAAATKRDQQQQYLEQLLVKALQEKVSTHGSCTSHVVCCIYLGCCLLLLWCS